jgi:ribosomal-protein-alanine N-acetyltransferase
MIKGSKINLRVVREKDIDTLFELESDIDNRGDYFPISFPSEPEFKKEFHQTGFWTEDFGQLLIVGKEDDRVLGIIICFKPVRYFDALEIAYILFDQQSRGQGYMTQALSLFANYLFELRKISRLQLTVIVGNVASKKVAEKCGFKPEGILRQAIFHRGRHVDLELFSLLRDELQTTLKK